MRRSAVTPLGVPFGMAKEWMINELYEQLDAFERSLREAGLKEASVRTYVGRSRYFVRWLDGDYVPQGPTR